MARRQGVSPSQIDAAYIKGLACSPLHIEERSRAMVSTDHERISVRTCVKGKVVGCRGHKGGARVVSGDIPPQTRVDQQTLEELAKRHSKPKPGSARFVPSRACNVLRTVAKRTRTAEDWKRYLRTLRQERDGWKAQRLESAASNWTQYRWVAKPAKAWEGDFFRECASRPFSKHLPSTACRRGH